MDNTNRLRSPGVIIGGVLALVATTACVCGGGGDDDDCYSMDQRGTVFAAGGSGIRAAEPAVRELSGALPATGGFGTHLASCGG